MDINRGKLWIIGNETIFLPVYEYKVQNGYSHTLGLIDFICKNQLPIDVEEQEYHEGPCKLAEAGHLVIKADEASSLLVFYIPEYVTDEQLNFVFSHQLEFQTYVVIGAFSRKDNQWEEKNSWNDIYADLQKKNISIHQMSK